MTLLPMTLYTTLNRLSKLVIDVIISWARLRLDGYRGPRRRLCGSVRELVTNCSAKHSQELTEPYGGLVEAHKQNGEVDETVPHNVADTYSDNVRYRQPPG